MRITWVKTIKVHMNVVENLISVELFLGIRYLYKMRVIFFQVPCFGIPDNFAGVECKYNFLHNVMGQNWWLVPDADFYPKIILK